MPPNIFGLGCVLVVFVSLTVCLLLTQRHLYNSFNIVLCFFVISRKPFTKASFGLCGVCVCACVRACVCVVVVVVVVVWRGVGVVFSLTVLMKKLYPDT